MAVPKRRTSKRRQSLRRSHHAISAIDTTLCPNCGEIARPHRVCGACGFYSGRQVVQVEEE